MENLNLSELKSGLENLSNLSTEVLLDELSRMSGFKMVKWGRRLKVNFDGGNFYLPISELPEGSKVEIKPSDNTSFICRGRSFLCKESADVVFRSPSLNFEYGLPRSWWHASWWPTRIVLSIDSSESGKPEKDICGEEYIESEITFSFFIPDPLLYTFYEVYSDQESVPFFIRVTVKSNYFFNPYDCNSEVWCTVNKYLLQYKKFYQTPREFWLDSKYCPHEFIIKVHEL